MTTPKEASVQTMDSPRFLTVNAEAQSSAQTSFTGLSEAEIRQNGSITRQPLTLPQMAYSGVKTMALPLPFRGALKNICQPSDRMGILTS
jgi:hypothetical protein